MHQRRMLELLLAPLLASALPQAASAAEISVSDANPRQGQTIEVKVFGLAAPQETPPSASQPTLKFKDSTVKLFAYDTGSGGSCYRTLLGIPADIDPGKYKITVGPDEKTIVVRDARFPVQHLSLPKSKDNFDMSPGEKETVDKAKETVTSERMWSQPFVRPSKARTSAQFGLRRVVNGRLLKDYFHSGLDFAGGMGSPIVACAPGNVVMARRGFKLHGNCVAIDHGQGVISIYIHMQKLLVKEGQHVDAAQQIGTIGMSGRANGPHLHFSLYVNDTATNPLDWFKNSFSL